METLDFRITSAQVDAHTYVVTIGGEADLFNVPLLENRLEDLARVGARHVVVDLSASPFIDSSILGALVGHAKRLRADGGALVVVSDDPRVIRAFVVTGLDRLFRIEPTLAQAVALPGAA